MKRFLKFLIVAVIVLVIVVLGYLKFLLPAVGKAPDVQATLLPDRIERGRYLANHVAVCMDCHSTRDWTRFSAPPLENTIGKGGEYFGPEMGFPGKFYSKNITPYHLSKWTDGEIYRTITTGVNRDGEALFPVMPYLNYGKMDQEDVLSIIAYLRTLAPQKNDPPAREVNFPMNFIINTIPQKATPGQRPDTADMVKRGEYLVTIAACVECHTPVEKGQIIPEKAFSGGREFAMPAGVLHTPNITPDVKTGIGAWSDSMFVSRFKSYSRPESLHPVGKNEFNTIMPWSMYAGMTEGDLKAIFAYLKTVKPADNRVVIFKEAKNK
ncbi:c-type cytochrome [Niabella drilacis]|uniref:Cytochrome c n=1 Tax=Niabella drilacis (strain DSM 25811 / CCM 8410 / CCUG 62505 / LMG 26954 / E90) TaxID=1285928 RepID=A0A1G6PTL8_NIADE|nr:c-type cytochrome [Niabella drilacis]SDC82715.1 Cytochrome c [Niabella drilacis]